MNAHPPAPRRDGLFGRPILTVTIVLAALIGTGAGTVALANRDSTTGAPAWRQPAPAATSGAPARDVATDTGPEPGTVTMSATGDIIMGNAPDRLPADDGAGFFDSVRPALRSDLVMGNLEQPLTGDTGASKCGSPPRPNCFAFRSPPGYAAHLREAGFDLLNTANNHARDYGAAGYRNTVEALTAEGLRHTGAAGQITVVEVEGVSIAVVGFSPYAGANDLNDLDAARAVVREAAGRSDVVVVQVHMGAEGADRTHVKPGSELYFGENRGDPVRFSHAVIDAGADVVIGHGPHVVRGMEFHRGRLIAYSLGNFAGGGRTLSRAGVLKYGAILHVSVRRDGTFAGGRVLSSYLDSAGVPTRDSTNERSRKLIAELSVEDFAGSAARIAGDGSITPPA